MRTHKPIHPIEAAYSQLRIVSLDVAFAALGGGILATRVIGAAPRSSFYWLLPSGVWVAYTVDHLLDARRIGPAPHTPRHRFHYQHAAPLWIAVFIVSIACGAVGWITLSWFGLIYAAIMCGLVILHETIIKMAGGKVSPFLLKELGVALVFTAGVWGMPWLRHRLDTGRIGGWPMLLMGQYFVLALINLMEFAIYESKTDAADGQTSFVRAIGRPRATRMVCALLILSLIANALGGSLHTSTAVIEVEATYFLMLLGLWLTIAKPRFAMRNERYRTLGDGVFLLPLLLVVMPR